MPISIRIHLLLLLSLLLVISCEKDSHTNSKGNWKMDGFVKMDKENPILIPEATQSFICPILNDTVYWEARNVLNPAAVIKDDKIHLFYRAQDINGTSRIGMAVSEDGIHFEKSPHPVFYPDLDSMKLYEWNFNKIDENDHWLEHQITYFDGVEDPRIVESETGKYIMTYTAYDGKTARLCVATSNNLTKWEKQGLAFKDSKYHNLWSKSGAIVAKQINGKNIAQKIEGNYWMYFGDTDLFIATSDDLIDWKIAENSENQKMISVMSPRKGYFDSRLVEPGPYALLTEQGILLIYNASNAANFNDPIIPKYTYAAGQALFDKNQPYKLLERTDTYFIHPDKEYEKIGEVNEVCFVEGLVLFNQKWFLYYGTADSKIAVAVKN